MPTINIPLNRLHLWFGLIEREFERISLMIADLIPEQLDGYCLLSHDGSGYLRHMNAGSADLQIANQGLYYTTTAMGAGEFYREFEWIRSSTQLLNTPNTAQGVTVGISPEQFKLFDDFNNMIESTEYQDYVARFNGSGD